MSLQAAPHLVPSAKRREGWIDGAFRRVLQLIAREAPGAATLRVHLHRWRGVTIGQGCWIGHDCILETAFPRFITLRDRVTLSVRVTIIAHFGTSSGVRLEDDVFVGPCAVILPGVTVGPGSVITAGTVVNRSVPPHTIVQGNPGRFIATCEKPLTNEITLQEFMKGYRPLHRGAPTAV